MYAGGPGMRVTDTISSVFRMIQAQEYECDFETM